MDSIRYLEHSEELAARLEADLRSLVSNHSENHTLQDIYQSAQNIRRTLTYLRTKLEESLADQIDQLEMPNNAP